MSKKPIQKPKPVKSVANTAINKAFLTSAEKFIGHEAFVAGVFIALIAGFIIGLPIDWIATYLSTRAMLTAVVLVLVILGGIVGFLNIPKKETIRFLVACTTLLIVGAASLTLFQYIPGFLGKMLFLMLMFVEVFVVPAAFIVAVKTIKELEER